MPWSTFCPCGHESYRWTLQKVGVETEATGPQNKHWTGISSGLLLSVYTLSPSVLLGSQFFSKPLHSWNESYQQSRSHWTLSTSWSAHSPKSQFICEGFSRIIFVVNQSPQSHISVLTRRDMGRYMWAAYPALSNIFIVAAKMNTILNQTGILWTSCVGPAQETSLFHIFIRSFTSVGWAFSSEGGDYW